MEDTKKCPFCAENIKIEAKICRYCGKDINITNNEKEEIIYKGKVNWSNYIIPVILLFMFPLTIFGIYYIYYHKTKVIILTNKKFTYSYGILSKKQLDIKLEKVESVQIKKNLLDMIFGSGTIIVYGTGGNNEPIYGIDNPLELKKAIDKQINI